MGKKKEAAPETEADTLKGPLHEDVPAESAEESEVGGKSDVVVKFRDHRGEIVSRTFSKDVHGKEFKALADEFRKKHAARIVT